MPTRRKCSQCQRMIAEQFLNVCGECGATVCLGCAIVDCTLCPMRPLPDRPLRCKPCAVRHDQAYHAEG